MLPALFRSPPTRAWREAWWVAALAAVAVVIFSLGLAVRVHCRLDGCVWAQDRYFDLDSIGGLPRLFITGLFVAVAVVAWQAGRRVTARPRTWWTAVAAIGAALAVLKLVSAHSKAKAAAVDATLIVGVLLSVIALGTLWWTARRWAVPAGPAVVVALAVYAFAALGLDVVTGAVASIGGSTGEVADAVATFVEELGEALGALLVLATVWWWLPAAEGVRASDRP